MTQSPTGMRWPSPTQLLLVQALCASDARFPRLWANWKNRAGPYAALDGASLDLFPFVYKRLSKLVPSDDWLTVTHNSYRYHWLHNQLLKKNTETATLLLGKNNIPTTLLKGAAWIERYYSGDWGARKLEDMDILVPHRCFDQAKNILLLSGWEPSLPTPIEIFDKHFFHSLDLKKGDTLLDLHAHLYHHHFSLKSSYFDNQLSDEQHLIHACVNAIEYSDTAQLRWIIDISQIIKARKINWDVLVGQSTHDQVAIPVNMALNYLSKNKIIHVPESALNRLNRAETRRVYRRLFELQLKGARIKTVEILENYWWIYYRSLIGIYNPITWVVRAVAYLKYRLDARRYRDLVPIIVRRVAHLLTKLWRGLAYA